jgi:leader peptidase (prepilin peptidase)/N-methyltransferase
MVTLFSFIFSLLMVISVYDIRHKIIPDTLVYAYAIISFASIFINHSGIGPLFALPSLMAVVSGPLFALPFALIWLLSRGKAMGLGDAKLMLGIGWMLGPLPALAATILSFWIGSVVSLSMMFFGKKKMGMKTEIPFAPFLIISALIVFLFNLDIFSLAGMFHL